MSTRRSQLTREAARLFAEKGYHGTSIGDLAEAMGVQKGSLYAHIASKHDLLYETMRDGADAFHGALDEIPEELPRRRRSGSRCAGTSRRRGAARRRHRLRARVALPRGRRSATRSSPSAAATRSGCARFSARGASSASCAPISTTATAALLSLSAANWAYTWLQPGRDTDELADRFYSLLIDGMRGYATPS